MKRRRHLEHRDRVGEVPRVLLLVFEHAVASDVTARSDQAVRIQERRVGRERQRRRKEREDRRQDGAGVRLRGTAGPDQPEVPELRRRYEPPPTSVM